MDSGRFLAKIIRGYIGTGYTIFLCNSIFDFMRRKFHVTMNTIMNLRYDSYFMYQACDFSRFLLISGFFTISRSHQVKIEVTCIVSKPLVSCWWGCRESVNPPKLNIQEVQGALSSIPKGDQGPLPIFLCHFAFEKEPARFET